MKQRRFFRYIHSLFALCGMLLLVLLASCNDLEDDSSENATGNATGKTVSVKIAVNDSFRTAMPSDVTLNQFSSFALAIDGVEVGTWNATAEKTAYEVMTAAAITVSATERTFVLTGVENGDSIYEGTIKTTLTADTVLHFSLALKEISPNGIGSMAVTYSYANAANVVCVVCELYKSDDGKTYTKDDYRINSRVTQSTSVDTNYTYSLSNIPAGKYVAAFTLKDENGATIDTWTEPVVITAEHKSTSTLRMAVNVFRITYNPSGGSVGKNAPLYYSSLDDVVIPDGTKENLTFGGWFADASFSEKLEGWKAMTYAKDMNLIAYWNAVISYNANDSTEAPATGTMESQTTHEGIEITLTKNAFEREGYVFNKWNTAADGTGTVHLDEEVYNGLTNANLYAQWVELPSGGHVVRFDSTGGSYVDLQGIADGGKVTEPANPTRTGFVFGDWRTSSDGGATLSDTAFDFTTDTISENTTLYAKWIESGVYKSESGEIFVNLHSSPAVSTAW